jgi:nucleotide-binding universal stress UspA family protein
MKTIIVPLDFSVESLTGLHYALMLANKMEANIQMVHVIEKDEEASILQKEQENQLAKLKFEDIVRKYKNRYHSPGSFTYIIKTGKISEEVTRMVEENNEAFIVLSTYVEPNFEELFMGGNAFRIATHSSLPVITIRSNKIPCSINKIVLPVDITFQTREKVPYTVKLAKLFNSEIHLVSVRLSKIRSIEKKLQQRVDQVAAYLDNQNIHYTIKHLQGDNLTDITLDYAQSVNADLISIMTEQEKTFSNLLFGSYAHQMISKAFIPVLSFPNYPLKVVTENIWDLGAFNARN